jgi:hypothetical protein
MFLGAQGKGRVIKRREEVQEWIPGEEPDWP